MIIIELSMNELELPEGSLVSLPETLETLQDLLDSTDDPLLRLAKISDQTEYQDKAILSLYRVDDGVVCVVTDLPIGGREILLRYLETSLNQAYEAFENHVPKNVVKS